MQPSTAQPVNGIIAILILVMMLAGVVDLVIDFSSYNSMWFFVPFAALWVLASITIAVQKAMKAAIVEAYLIIEKYTEEKMAAHDAAHSGDGEEVFDDIESVFDSEGIRRG